MSLADIGRKNFTEKANLGFLDIYEEHWQYLQRRDFGEISLLEIGVYNGNSIKTWLDWFPGAHIIGIDNNPQSYTHDISGATLYKGDQSDIEFLQKVIVECGPQDIIIDDGGHHWDEQQISLMYLWPHVKPGGMYIIEDLQTSADQFFAPKENSHGPTAPLLGEYAALLASDHMIYMGGNVASMHIYPRLCIIKKDK